MDGLGIVYEAGTVVSAVAYDLNILNILRICETIC